MLRWAGMSVGALLFAAGLSGPAAAEVSAFSQALATAAAEHPQIADYYRERSFEPIWTGGDDDDLARLRALTSAFEAAALHGLPDGRYSVNELREALEEVRTESDRGEAEVAVSRIFLRYAQDVSSGLLDPREADAGIKRERPQRSAGELLGRIDGERPAAGFRALPPASPEYVRLLDARLRLEDVVAGGGWGAPVPQARLALGDRGPDVQALRDRLARMGYLARADRAEFDDELEAAVLRFQTDHGLLVDGIFGPGTRAALNVSARDRLGQVLVALERERWMNFDRGARHVWVNLADFTAKIVDDGRTTFETRAVVGARASDRQSPEFSDEMEHMVVNPTWNVPRSIAVEEYLPQLKRNPGSNRHLEIYYEGRPISRDRINWPAVTAQNWPFRLKQPPSRSNALGLVKFMFPNRWSIYLHDTPAKELFQRNVRDFSHGCIRLNEPFEFAYALLSRQTDDPEGLFHARLSTGREITIPLETHVPVHLVYRTALTTPRGVQFRDDIYGRDARILDALTRAGVALPRLGS